jgi:eukaryotic-like serine/threonine-protein kinase
MFPVPLLSIGTVLAGRYEVLEILGEGGMGAVYKVQDRELDRFVALKTIRPELAGNTEMLRRFKQELILARQIAHRNIVRLYDISDVSGVKFITMEYVDGEDFRTVLRRQGKLTAEESVKIIRQICLALEAAHSEGVIHRDLKPQNLMRDKQGRIVVMDFGLARALESGGMTQTGALVGTMEYMSPEQAKGENVGPASDIYAAGLIFYELLTGKMPYQAKSALASLLKRAQEHAIPVSEIEKSVPRHLSAIVSRCIEPDRKKRYQNAAELLADLEAFDPSARTFASVIIVRRGAIPAAYKWIAIALLVLLIATAGIFGWRRFATEAEVTHAPVSVLVADFTNHTGDPIFDGTLEPMFNFALEGAKFVNAFSRGEARRLAGKLPNPTDQLDEQAARLVAVRQGVGTVVTGSLSRREDGYKLSIEALDATTGKTIANSEMIAATKDDLLLGVPKLVAPIRKALGDVTPESVQLAAAGPFTAASLEVVHQYSIAMDQQYRGKMDDALHSFAKTAELDPNFARAYSGMASTSSNLGRREDAEKYVKLAMEHVDRMTERERYNVRALYYLNLGNYQKCMEEYATLVGQYPADRAAHSNFALCASELRNLPKAVEEMRRAVEIFPNGAVQRMNFSVFASYGGDFHTGEQQAIEVQRLNPSYEKGYIALAFAQIGKGQFSQAAETYQRLEKVSPRGASLASMGLADLALYEGRFREAAQQFERGAARDLAAKGSEAAAYKYALLAYTRLLMQQSAPALEAADKALTNSRSAGTRFLAARIFVEAGQPAKAEAMAARLAPEQQLEAQAYAKLILGEVALKQKDVPKAIQLFTEAKRLLDTWIGRFDLGRAYLEAGQFAEADSEFDRCIKRRGESLALFLDEVPTYGYFPMTYYFAGRTREGLKSGFADFYRQYVDIRGQAGEDPLLPEIRRSAGR